MVNLSFLSVNNITSGNPGTAHAPWDEKRWEFSHVSLRPFPSSFLPKPVHQSRREIVDFYLTWIWTSISPVSQEVSFFVGLLLLLLLFLFCFGLVWFLFFASRLLNLRLCFSFFDCLSRCFRERERETDRQTDRQRDIVFLRLTAMI